MAVLRNRISPSPLSLEMTACWAYSVTKLFSPFLGLCGPCQALWTGVPRRCMAASARTRSEEEKRSRKAAREETTTAHNRFPFLPTRCTRQVYVLDKDLADEIAQNVIKNQNDPSTPILETNPGPGVLTKALLEAGAKRIVLAESLKGFMPYVQEVQEECKPHIAASYNMDYLSFWRRAGDPDSASTEFESSMATLFPHRLWEQGPPVSVVAMLPEKKEWPFLNHLILAYSRQQSFYSLGRPEWFLAVSPAVYTKLMTVKMEQQPAAYYHHLAVVLHLLFDVHLCAQLPGWKFTPRFPEKRVRVVKKNTPEVSNSMRYLLHFRPHVDQPLALAEIPAFYMFLVQLMKKKKLRLIPKMEQLVPGCGPHLIKLHVTMMSLVADMSPHQFLTIFKAMQTWPEYQGSPLKQILMSEYLLTADGNNADDIQEESRSETGTKTGTDATGGVHKDS